MCLCAVHVVETYNVRMDQPLEYLNFILHHLQTWGREAPHFYDFNSIVLFILADSFVDPTTVSGSNLVSHSVPIVPNTNLVLPKPTGRGEKFGSRTTLAHAFGLAKTVLLGRRYQLIGWIVPLTHLVIISILKISPLFSNYRNEHQKLNQFWERSISWEKMKAIVRIKNYISGLYRGV